MPLDFSGVVIGIPLITLEECKTHLRITDTWHDADITQKLMLAQTAVSRYLTTAGDPTWDETTVPDDVKGAILLLLTNYFEHRGDDIGGTFEPVLLVHSRLGRKEDSAPFGAGQPASRFRLEAVDSRMVVWDARPLRGVPRGPLTVSDRPFRLERPHNPWREAVQERVVRQIRMLRAMRRELETGLRRLPHGHAGGNPGHGQGAAYG